MIRSRFGCAIKKSPRKNKQLVARCPGKDPVHFGDPDMPEFPGTKRGDNYCARSFGIKDSNGRPTRNDKGSANFWSRKVLWNCKRKKSKRR